MRGILGMCGNVIAFCMASLNAAVHAQSARPPTFGKYMPGQLLVHVQLIQWRCKEGQHLLVRNDFPFILWILEVVGFDILPKSLHNLHARFPMLSVLQVALRAASLDGGETSACC